MQFHQCSTQHQSTDIESILEKKDKMHFNLASGSEFRGMCCSHWWSEASTRTRRLVDLRMFSR